MEIDEVEAFSAANIENIDSEDQMDPQLVSEYVNDIYEYMRMLEREQSVKKNYLETQKGTGNESKLHSNEPCLIGLTLFNQSIIYLISKSILQELFYQRCELFLLIGWLRYINSFRCCKKHSFWLWQ